MEDISRELEREIARAKPTPHKTNRKKKVLVVDDFGVMKSGTYLAVLVRFLTVISLAFGLAAAGLYYLYDRQADQNLTMKAKLAGLEKKKDQLTKEKEILMARLVMAGERPVLDSSNQGQDTGINEKKPEIKKTRQEIAASQIPDGTAAREPEPGAPDPAAVAMLPEVNDAGQDGANKEDVAGISARPDEADNTPDAQAVSSQVIAVEKFSVSRGQGNGELKARFNIRNVKEGPGEISGRIFLVLKPESGSINEWIVAPKVPLAEGGIPSVFKRGQYFSISRFKPVVFTIKSSVVPERLKTASVYIFDDEGQLIFNDIVKIALNEDS